ncbi:MAG: pilus assembly protein TadG-related protein [Pseudomonadota bacterium]
MRVWSPKNEQGTLTIFALITYTTAIALAGMAIDLARAEMQRTRMQLAVDNAVLAAASLRLVKHDDTGVPLTTQEIVDLYLAKADVPKDFTYTTSTDASGTMADGVEGGRIISVESTTTMGALFMDLVGVDTLTVGAIGQAMELPEDPVEVSLVLDMSASMNSAEKMDSMIEAAKGFVTTVLAMNDGDNPHLATISLIIYGGYVNAGRDLAAVMNNYYFEPEKRLNQALWEGLLDGDDSAPGTVGTDAGDSEIHVPIAALCGIFEDTAFNSTALWAPEEFSASLPTTHSRSNGARMSNTGYDLHWPYCGNEVSTEILPFSNDEAALHQRLDEIGLTWGTAIDDGMLWGTLLLDPSAQPGIAMLTDDSFADVPNFPSHRETYVEEPVLDGDGNPILGEDGLPITVETRVVSSTQAVDPAFADRPLPFGQSMKVVVMMSDGSNVPIKTPDPNMFEGYLGGWIGDTTDDSVTQGWAKDGPNEDDYLWYDPETRDLEYGTSSEPILEEDEDPSDYFRMTWDDLFAVKTMTEVARFEGLASVHGYDPERNRVWQEITVQRQNSGQKNDRLHANCDAARDAGMIVFTVAYEANANAGRVLARCADETVQSNDDVDDAQNFSTASAESINTVFAGIANSLRKLQLTQ